jgi:thiamine-phosphate pyrophosphorylase
MAMTARLLAISDRRAFAGEQFEEWLAALGRAGVDAVQIREKDLDDRALYALVRQARSLLPPGVRLLVNGRLDVALAAGADGAHLPADGAPLVALRRRFGQGVLLGRSTHRPEEVDAARRDGADYVVFGPVYPTPGKGRHRPTSGLAGLAEAARLGIPVYALGGVTLGRLAEVAAAGAVGAAGVRLFREPGELPGLVAAAALAFQRP